MICCLQLFRLGCTLLRAAGAQCIFYITRLYIFCQTEGYGALLLLSLICGVVSCLCGM